MLRGSFSTLDRLVSWCPKLQQRYKIVTNKSIRFCSGLALAGLLPLPQPQTGRDTPSTSAKDCPGAKQALKIEWDAYQITFSNSHGGGVAPYFNPYIAAVPGQKFDVQYVAAFNYNVANRSFPSTRMGTVSCSSGDGCMHLMPIFCEA
jgi:hypothetical protein